MGQCHKIFDPHVFPDSKYRLKYFSKYFRLCKKFRGVIDTPDQGQHCHGNRGVLYDTAESEPFFFMTSGVAFKVSQ